MANNASITNSILIYPPELPETGVRIAFAFYKFNREGAMNPTKYTSLNNFIFLPIPDNLVDSYNIEHDEYNAGVAGRIVNALADAWNANDPLSAIDKISNKLTSFKNIKEMVSGALDTLGAAGSTGLSGLESAIDAVGSTKVPSLKSIAAYAKTAPEGAKYGASGIARNTFNDAGRIISAIGGVSEDFGAVYDNLLGAVPNPNSTVGFKSPHLRSHKFSWVMAAKSAQESALIQTIIDTFKTNFLPAVSAESYFFNFPNIVFPEFIGVSQNLYTFKPCVITDFTVDYAAGGRPSFFMSTKAPTLLSISLELNEVQLFLQKDVGLTQAEIFNNGAQIFSVDSNGNLIPGDDLNVILPQ